MCFLFLLLVPLVDGSAYIISYVSSLDGGKNVLGGLGVLGVQVGEVGGFVSCLLIDT